MDDIEPVRTHGSMAKGGEYVEENIYDGAQGSSARAVDGEVGAQAPALNGRPKPKQTYSHAHYKVYKRRWLGLAQLVLLNIVVSWDVSSRHLQDNNKCDADKSQWLTFAPVSTSAATYFNVSETAINWLSTAFLFSFSVAAPLVIWTLHRSPKESILWASGLLLAGNWIRYAGTRANGGIFGIVMFGQILTGLAQPFVLAAPTRYSDMWFTERGRVGATALASLANPFGGAVSASLRMTMDIAKSNSSPNSSTLSSARSTRSF
jgi:FLVCR family MFS transporter 7